MIKHSDNYIVHCANNYWSLMIKRIDIRELPLDKVSLDDARLELITTSISDYSTFSFSFPSSVAYKRISG